MTRTNNNNRRRRNGNNRLNRNRELHEDLRQTNRILMNQNTRVLPTQPDIQEITWSARHLYNFRYVSQGATITYPANQAITSASITVNPSNLPEWPSLSAVFDNYRILQAKVTFVPAGSTTMTPGLLYTVIDTNDGNVVNAAATFLQYDTVQMVDTTQLVERVFTPYYPDASNTLHLRDWIQTSNPKNHFGVKYGLVNSANAIVGNPAYTVFVTMYLQFKNLA